MNPSINEQIKKKSFATAVRLSILIGLLLAIIFSTFYLISIKRDIEEKVTIDNQLLAQSLKIGDLFFIRKYLHSFVEVKNITSISIQSREDNQIIEEQVSEKELKSQSPLTQIQYIHISDTVPIYDNQKPQWNLSYHLKINIFLLFFPILLSLFIGYIIYLFLKKQFFVLAKHFTQPLSALHKDISLFKLNLSKSNLEVNNYSTVESFTEIDSVVSELQNLIRQTKKQEIELLKSEVLKTEVKLSRQVAHDIRSPLSALNAISDKLEGNKRSLLQKAIHRIESIADDLSNSAKLKNKDVFKTNIVQLSKAIVSEKKLEYKNYSNINLSLKSNEDSLFTNINSDQMKRCLSNIINNGYDALSEEGSITFSIYSSNLKIILDIEDNGKGIPGAIIDSIFDYGISFEKEHGNGLGLSYAKECVEKWHGTIEVISEIGSGTLIRIKLPQVLS